MVGKLNITYIKDKKGNNTAVQIPLKEWESIKADLKIFLEYQSLKKELTSAFEDVELMKSGKKDKVTFNEFINGLK